MTVAVKSHVKINLSKRVEEARAAARFAKITSRDPKNRARTITVPGHDTRYYQVIFKRIGNELQAECLRDVGALGMQPCPARNFVCYHVISATLALAKDASKEISVCSDWEDAVRLSNLGGTPVQIINKKRTDSICVVVK